MNASVALHTAARRYCLEQHARWCERYAELGRQGKDRQPDGYGYSPEALATFPRYNVLSAIRVDLERLDPSGLGGLEDARALLVLAGMTAENEFTRRPSGEIDRRAMAEERDAFCRYVAGLEPSDLEAVAGLPYRRVLTAEESRSLWSTLRARWQISGSDWYPLTGCAAPGVVAFKARAFEEAVPHQRLQRILVARGIERVWELREFGPEYEQDLALFEPFYNGAEGYWSSEGMDWIVYASHEGSVTVAGWLLQELEKECPLEALVWTGAFD
jgi:hypothetical protein